MAFLKGKGTTIAIGNATITQVTNITAPAMEMGTHETTHLTSTVRTYDTNIINVGEASFTVEYDPDEATHASLWAAFQNGTDSSFTITYPTSNSTCAFNGRITKFPIAEAAVDNVVTLPITIQCTSLPVITP